MRLLHTETLHLHEFQDNKIPKYAILSHTWEDEELSYHDIVAPVANLATKKGYAKMSKAALKSKALGYEYLWIDTCCIDKSSSAELSEAINSMFKWYQNSSVCIAYLSDVSLEQTCHLPTYDKLKDSRWFTRGWTLQELIAPTELTFYDVDWRRIGTKSGISFSLASITSIAHSVLISGLQDDISVAERMRWASKRQTTRTEDIAYSLLGIFNVKMPLLYGEGENAFFRLQEEIIKKSDDHTIFLWKDEKAELSSHFGLIARSPEEFAAPETNPTSSSTDLGPEQPYEMTNLGLRMSLHLQPITLDFLKSEGLPISLIHEPEIYYPLLHTMNWSQSKRAPTVLLKRLQSGSKQFARIMANRLVTYDSESLAAQPGNLETIYVRQDIRIPDSFIPSRIYAITVSTVAIWNCFDCHLITPRDENLSSPWQVEVLRPIPNDEGFTAEVVLTITSGDPNKTNFPKVLNVVLGYDAATGTPWFELSSRTIDLSKFGFDKGNSRMRIGSAYFKAFMAKKLYKDRIFLDFIIWVDTYDRDSAELFYAPPKQYRGAELR